MSCNAETFWDSLCAEEREAAKAIVDHLQGREWARPLIRYIEANGGITRVNKSRLLELRFGYALESVGIEPCYEIPGEGHSTIDFGFSYKNQAWAVELIRLEITHAVRNATGNHLDEDGTSWTGLHLYSNAEDLTQSVEGEMLKAVERICQKCERNGRPYKFPLPQASYHAILVDVRTFLDPDGNDFDLIHIAFGGESVPPGHGMRWKGNLISGVFSARTNVHGAKEAQRRVHFLGFVRENDYTPGKIGEAIKFIVNPNLFPNTEGAQAAIATWPLQPTKVLDGR